MNTTYKNYSISITRSIGGACIITISEDIHWKATLDFVAQKSLDADKFAKDFIDSVLLDNN